jgi:hypothetical protein
MTWDRYMEALESGALRQPAGSPVGPPPSEMGVRLARTLADPDREARLAQLRARMAEVDR